MSEDRRFVTSLETTSPTSRVMHVKQRFVVVRVDFIISGITTARQLHMATRTIILEEKSSANTAVTTPPQRTTMRATTSLRDPHDYRNCCGRGRGGRFDVVFARIPCGFLSLDAEDALGIPQEDLRHDVTRTRLDSIGRALGETCRGRDVWRRPFDRGSSRVVPYIRNGVDEEASGFGARRLGFDSVST